MAKGKIQSDLLVVGGGTSGVCAAIQAARDGLQVALVEETPWLGGMLTAAGVSAVDGNHRLPSGLWGEFRQKLYEHYGGPGGVKTGWVTHTAFEPRVANQIFHEMVAGEKGISLHKGYWIEEVTKKNQQVIGATFRNDAGNRLTIEASLTIDCTEYGDVMALAGCAYRVGRESRAETGEPGAPAKADGFIQDLTYVAILKDYGPGADRTIPRPAGYDPKEYYGCCREWSDGNPELVDARTMLDYGKLPNDRYMINWPKAGNDYYADYLEKDRQERLNLFEHAKQQTLSFVYFIQSQLGFKHLGLADDEFPTADDLALIPYIRESRRLQGMVQLTVDDLVDPYKGTKYQQGIAVGDYPLDHHHGKVQLDEPEEFPPIPSFNVPYGCLVPEQVDGLLVAEKSISVTHLVNGCTRLQPCVMQIGQAAGAAADLCLKYAIQPRQLNIRELQQALLQAGCWLMPFLDVTPADWYFDAVQRVALCGLMFGEGKANNWANEFWFYPQKGISGKEVISSLKAVNPQKKEWLMSLEQSSSPVLNRAEVLQICYQFLENPKRQNRSALPFQDVRPELPQFEAIAYFYGEGLLHHWVEGPFLQPDGEMSRAVFAFLLDRLFHPFSHKLTPGDNQ